MVPFSGWRSGLRPPAWPRLTSYTHRFHARAARLLPVSMHYRTPCASGLPLEESRPSPCHKPDLDDVRTIQPKHSAGNLWTWPRPKEGPGMYMAPGQPLRWLEKSLTSQLQCGMHPLVISTVMATVPLFLAVRGMQWPTSWRDHDRCAMPYLESLDKYKSRAVPKDPKCKYISANTLRLKPHERSIAISKSTYWYK